MTDSAPRLNGNCPLRPPEPCQPCQLSPTGRKECPLMYLVSDDELRASLHGFLQHHRLATA